MPDVDVLTLTNMVYDSMRDNPHDTPWMRRMHDQEHMHFIDLIQRASVKDMRILIPDGCRSKDAVIQMLSEEEFLQVADATLDYALINYHISPCLYTLGELLNLIYTVAKERGISEHDLDVYRAGLSARNGGYSLRKARSI